MKKILSNKTSRNNFLTYAIVIVLFVVMQVLSAAGMLSYSIRGQLVPICVYIVLAVSLNLVVGISGELSLGHAGFMGVGAFSGAVIATVLQSAMPDSTLRLLVSMVVGGIFVPPMGVIDGSVLKAGGILLGFGSVAQVPELARRGTDVTIQHGQTSLSVNNPDKEDDNGTD